MIRWHAALSLLLLLALPAFAVAQTPEQEAKKARHQTRPEGWNIRPDRAGADTSEIYFATIEPGFHVTTGPAAIFWHPDSTATGSFRAEVGIHLFDPGRRREAYGLFVGGRNLDGPNQAYTYFLVRRTGEYLIKRRTGSDTETLVGWTAHDAVVSWDEKDPDAQTTLNTLAVEAGPEELVFRVNGSEVDRVPREGLGVEGVVGVRVNHALNVHVGGIEIEEGRGASGR
ncbi:MAG: hypothetical protein GWM92_11335 [Gemmatimonadetes bacterium]|nr:hypothetical protein [Gemmatimonadota bacterium]NIR79290.1 hypothetical protein [Gemmatimonadota bacterium]NIT87947.1 hypothetical protein [Gemmatimonadota bacterium]NIU31798.1 hypothetical protein [Gemmatimonadota bacterium]NIU36413.1 hypothetical protein [Gemmatimonadota bacterium]